jgi:hypothetical protein
MKSAIPDSVVQEGRILVCDNYYNTMTSVAWVKSKKMNVIGTVQANRFDLGVQWELPKSAKRGKVRILEQVDEDLFSEG